MNNEVIIEKPIEINISGFNSIIDIGTNTLDYLVLTKDKEEHIKCLNESCNTRQARRQRERKAKKSVQNMQ